MGTIKLTKQPELLTSGEAATILNVSPQTLREWTENNKINAYVTDGGHRRYEEVQVRLLALNETARHNGQNQATYYYASSKIELLGEMITVDLAYYVKPQKFPAVYSPTWAIFPDMTSKLLFDPNGAFYHLGTKEEGLVRVVSKGEQGYALTQTIAAVAFTKQAVIAELEKAIELAKQKMQQDIKPVYGPCGYMSLDDGLFQVEEGYKR